MEYRQKDTRKLIDEMRTAARRTANHDISNVLTKASERMSEMESYIVQLEYKTNEMLKDNMELANKLEETTQRLQEAKARGNGFDYDALLIGFVKSGKDSMRILLEQHDSPSGTAWYTPQLKRVRAVIDRLKLPVEAIQRTSSKNPDVTPVMYLIRTDEE